eukprot:CAMPEP_0197857878 /NCGR_PEP_ID=MMETSP1438-20131217/31299_1 /TAXON_ID=1461541 /ORGANISM="Pterosperma sp., Strain CCMP1384" /LENGTH=305 /DNA_ID=CAMNT_0043473869 /DNA_START=18 /DNA_END=931 /DNA_ORIENTATION=-
MIKKGAMVRQGAKEVADIIAQQEHPAQLRQWASDRSQVLGRTIRGVMRITKALRVLGRIEGIPEEELENVVDTKFEYIVSCQIYGKLKTSDKPVDRWKAQSIDELRRQFPRSLKVAFIHQEGKDFYSMLLGVDPESGEDTIIYKVKLPGNPILGEGKPENQNHAIIFSRGEYVMTLDMNQDNYMGESYKIRNLLEQFQGKTRIVGFREHAISGGGGAVADFAASAEFSFTTTTQRFLTWPLMVRFHYGHPDIWDKTFTMTSGGVSKSSKTLHISEDIFGGINAVLRGGDVAYAEFIHCGKGRDLT